ncbi:MAG: 30S ribosomal protein S6 [Candidatus Komeilibacteria bacterium]|jgi:ribosomal protein S6|nr:30S ribosomal protein S6 [Candidatus Komeilibacteria bacterium]MBT4447977.1 30S ribosomal protein S6 [Candidatus Komeilibacteria bacterium]
MKYELSFIISPAIAETDHPSVNQEVLDYLKGIDAKITREPYFMGRRKLAYPIAKQKHGFYVGLEFESEVVASLKDLDTKLKHNNSLLRYLVIKLEGQAENAAVDFSKMEEKEIARGRGKETKKVKVSAAKAIPKKAEPKEKIVKEKIKLEDIDKKLDEILEEPKLD